MEEDEFCDAARRSSRTADPSFAAALELVSGSLFLSTRHIAQHGPGGWDEPPNPFHFMKTKLTCDGAIEGWQVFAFDEEAGAGAAAAGDAGAAGEAGEAGEANAASGGAAAAAAPPGCAVVLRIGERVSGWDGIVHGGFTASVVDQVVGHHFCNKGLLGQVGFTANLSVSFTAPLPAECVLVVLSRLEKVERRKYFFAVSCRLFDPTTPAQLGMEVATATCLYIVSKAEAAPTYTGGRTQKS